MNDTPKTPECYMCGTRGSEPMDAVRYHASGRIRRKFRCTDRPGCSARMSVNYAKARMGILFKPGK